VIAVWQNSMRWWGPPAMQRECGVEIVTVELVGGGLAEWPHGQGPRGETIAPAAFVDVSGSEHLLELPHHFHVAGITAWRARAGLQVEPAALTVTVSAPVEAAFRMPLDARKHAALLSAVVRDAGIYVVPTTPRFGINARLARDQSVWVEVDADFADTWKMIRGV
jgi:hypothetical protein